ncbi:1,2-phenylacetyl-CoA epoxidase, subunit C [Roseivivax sp. THAF40]|uniref:1,2-phenylacetyl-CoA epoxidase subunit PaaC n=1 Tax=unclassified Roseivivax TaxID=2639302 RepID=UPI001268D342|nr:MULTISPECIES: 1,2-phenylacetyl-CoA epoxidase subunit PaaC [unclassified Roseivivax]QFS83513.1 1,2-phenylacetyl-CoA epoxidase, subunit C [Roseivivax sp. THAF197b]QFT47258.1 1,2-phenylacetyl-CoA epoxidase, subunit C [Roseivivax sp. THAF40]
MAEVIALDTADPLFAADRAAAFDWLCRLGDATLILGHRLSEWCGKGPALEEDIALANVSLDLIGHTEMWLALAGEVEGKSRSADDLAFLRDAMKFRNPLLVELPNRDMALTTMRQFLFDAWHYEMLDALTDSRSARVAEIAAKALKEVSYHLERSQDLVIRLGDGTKESHARMQDALERLWPYSGELFAADHVDEAMAEAGLGPDPAHLRAPWRALVEATLAEATLALPETSADVHHGGKTGRHTEHLGFLLAEMQFLQRAYPGAEW